MRQLTKVKGIGEWSVQMHMIIRMHRPDVLPCGDLAVRKGCSRIFNLKGKGLDALSGKARDAKMRKICKGWSPFASVGSWYMWKAADAGPLPSD